MNPTEQRMRACERMANAKRQCTEAARAALAGDPQAPDLTQAAFGELCAARADLAFRDTVTWVDTATFKPAPFPTSGGCCCPGHPIAFLWEP